MIDQWFKKDLQDIYEEHNVAVFIDESGNAEFLLNTVENNCTIYRTDSEPDELNAKYRIEKEQPSDERYLIYTRSKKDKLKFIREYCETCGCLEISYLQNYIKEKVHRSLNLNINFSTEELITAAKVSVGKDQSYWQDLCHKGSAEIFDLKRELLPFVHEPEKYTKEKYDDQIRETFYRKVNDLLGQEYLNKPATTLAAEVVKAILDGLLAGCCNKTLELVYHNWLDSVSYRDSFNRYLDRYKLGSEKDIRNISINHPFRQVDERWLSEVGQNLADRVIIKKILPKLDDRNKSKAAQSLGILFWSDVIVLLEFDSRNIAYLSSLGECIGYYKKHFCKLDTAIRNLYAEFLNKKDLLEPFQQLYKEYVSIFLDKWFSYFSSYKENQTGTLQRIINESGVHKTAVIVGDGVSYEIAEQVAIKVNSSAEKTHYVLKKESILADVPSETENNMSRIYMDNGITEPNHREREKYLFAQNRNLSIDFIRLDEVNDEVKPGQFLICTYKDIDDMGEKLQQKALKYFTETIAFFAKKIDLLLSTGYIKVYLISDHGFVLTGILTDSDKITANIKGKLKTKERYIQVEDELSDDNNFVTKENRGSYFCFAKSINPFTSIGAYGFSHGGATPQELITPYFCWERLKSAATLLSVTIDNKEELKDVTGDLFSIKILAEKGEGDLFSIDRKVCLIFFADKTVVNTSDVFTIHRNGQSIKEYTFDTHPELEVHLLDAVSKEHLDRAIIKKNKIRDFGGLL